MRRISRQARIATVGGILLSSACGHSAFAQEGHLVSRSDWTRAPAPVETMNRQIEARAQGILRDLKKEGLPTNVIARMVFCDIAYPANAQEYRRLSGHGVILVTAMSRDKTELPLRRVFAVSGERSIELERISLLLTEQKSDSASSVVFGRYRADALYAFPVALRTRPGRLRADFAKNRADFDFVEFDGSIDDALRAMPISSSGKEKVPQKEIEAFVQREYPGFIDRK